MSNTTSNEKNYNILAIAATFLLGAFVTFLNSTFMNVALQYIMKDLNISVSTVQWLSTGYMLATGIIIPITGPGMRFTLSETMVKFLVLSIIKPKGKLTLDTFLDKLYEHYGIVIDSVHYENEIRKNEKVYIDDLSMLYKNKMAFQQMLKDCGFLRDLSDSTSIVENPYDGGDMFE